MPATTTNFVTHEFPTYEADAIALEHISWAKQAGLTPYHVLRSLGCDANYGRRTNWEHARKKLRRLHICLVQPLLNTQDRQEKAA